MQKEIKAITRKWGNSIAIVIPNEFANKENIKENIEVKITIEKTRPKAGVLWGFGKGKFKRSTEETIKEVKAGWLSASDREREAKWKNQK
ncbi:MAG: AbrB/MazE/SpoVT family DNA-binding domain-containing protein [Nanoarchaeota archaeon]